MHWDVAEASEGKRSSEVARSRRSMMFSLEHRDNRRIGRERDQRVWTDPRCRLTTSRRWQVVVRRVRCCGNSEYPMSGQYETRRVPGHSKASPMTITGTSNLRRPPPRRVATTRTTNASYVDVALPTWIEASFRRIIADCDARPLPKPVRRVVARDLYEEALKGLIQRMDGGERVLFLSTPIRHGVRKKLWIDGDLKDAVERLAQSADVTQGSVVVTAFHHFLEARGTSMMP